MVIADFNDQDMPEFNRMVPVTQQDSHLMTKSQQQRKELEQITTYSSALQGETQIKMKGKDSSYMFRAGTTKALKKVADKDAFYRDSRNIIRTNGVRKAKTHLESNLTQDLKGNKKGFFKYISSKRKTRETVGPLLNGAGIW
ncbi:hypothetical protein QYF61_009763 [Mycteria americana]|uniref:Uncharacterized protein n=1 Tax=Mycteria americana TaxID=33587 RepID=A0AAN7S2Z0_MYCAM|nr:hypothetical protein QYF61_009763 [Mycteria americana]